jgi:hypothetical protein
VLHRPLVRRRGFEAAQHLRCNNHNPDARIDQGHGCTMPFANRK